MIKLGEISLKFIEENEELLKEDNFTGIYRKAEDAYYIGELTDFFMLDCEINLWNYLDEIPKCMFSWSTQRHVHIPIKYDKIPESMFISSEIEKVDIPNSIKSIESRAFWGCRNLKEIYLPKSITKIGLYAFYGSLVEIKTPKRDESNKLIVPVNDEEYLNSIITYV